jgi:peptidoglycan hydrolase-like protein with peptidoglycan-binding domain
MFLTLGSEGESVEKLQERLADGGYDVGPVDGTFGRRTREAVVELQRETELPATGTVTAATAEELDLDIDVSEVEDTRSNFTRLLMQNPNYFCSIENAVRQQDEWFLS